MAQTMTGRASKEATEKQLELARRQGEAFGQAVREMTQEEAHGEQTESGDLIVGYAVEDAEGMYQMVDGELQWQEPSDENAHIEIVACDRHDGRFIPGLDVTVTVHDEQGEQVGSHRQPFLWHPWLFHYGRNWKLPGSGTYRLSVRIEPPTFGRHDKINGQRFSQPVEVEWRDVRIETGQKKS